MDIFSTYLLSQYMSNAGMVATMDWYREIMALSKCHLESLNNGGLTIHS